MKVRLSLVAVAMLALLLALGVLMSADSSAETQEISTVEVVAGITTTQPVATTPLAVPDTTTTAAPAVTTTAAPPVTAPPRPSAPACATWSSQADVDAWMAANAATHNTSGIDTNGDGKACTLQFAPKPAPVAAAQTPAPVASSGTGSSADEAFLACVVQRESRGNPTAINPSSGAAGLFQFLTSTWINTVNHAGRPDLAGIRAHQASVADQWAMARHLLAWQGRSPWAYPSSPC